MSEVLTIVIYILICRELGQLANFPGNEYFWNSINDNSYAPSLADLTVFAASHENCKNKAFNYANGDIFVWKYIWRDFTAYFGLEVCVQTHYLGLLISSNWNDVGPRAELRQSRSSRYPFKRDRHGGMGRGQTGCLGDRCEQVWWQRQFGWQRNGRTLDTWIETYRSFENAGVLPSRATLLRN